MPFRRIIHIFATTIRQWTIYDIYHALIVKIKA
jgi:hypothetical protein